MYVHCQAREKYFENFDNDCPNRRIRSWSDERRTSIAHEILERIIKVTNASCDDISRGDAISTSNGITFDIYPASDMIARLIEKSRDLSCDRFAVSINH